MEPTAQHSERDAARASNRGTLSCDLANAAARIHREYVGRGPTKTRAVLRDDVVVLLLGDGMTQAERTLAGCGRPDLAVGLRRRLQQTMREDLVRVVEEGTGCRVLAFFSDSLAAPDMDAQLFVLDRPVEYSPRPPS
jgi:uncharacterized protein YbcI